MKDTRTTSLDSALGLDLDDPVTVAAIEDADSHMNLVSCLVHLRNEQEISQTEVGRRMETTQSRVSNFERLGGDPRLSTLFRYARAVNARLRWVVQSEPLGWHPVQRLSVQSTVSDDEEDATIVPISEGQWKQVADA